MSEGLPQSGSNKTVPSFRQTAILFLAADLIFIAFHYSLDILGIPQNWAVSMKIAAYVFSYTAWFTLFVFAGFVLSLVVVLITKGRKSFSKKGIFLSAVFIGILISIYFSRGSWLFAQHVRIAQ